MRLETPAEVRRQLRSDKRVRFFFAGLELHHLKDVRAVLDGPSILQLSIPVPRVLRTLMLRISEGAGDSAT